MKQSRSVIRSVGLSLLVHVALLGSACFIVLPALLKRDEPDPAPYYLRKPEEKIRYKVSSEREEASGRPLMPKIRVTQPQDLKVPDLQLELPTNEYMPVVGLGNNGPAGLIESVDGEGHEGIVEYLEIDFFGIKDRAENVAIIFDVSGSMLQPDRGGAEGYEAVKERLRAIISEMSPMALFNVYAFGMGLDRFSDRPMQATEAMKANALTWVSQYPVSLNAVLQSRTVTGRFRDTLYNNFIPSLEGTAIMHHDIVADYLEDDLQTVTLRKTPPNEYWLLPNMASRMDLALMAAFQDGCDAIFLISDGLPIVREGFQEEDIEHMRKRIAEMEPDRALSWLGERFRSKESLNVRDLADILHARATELYEGREQQLPRIHIVGYAVNAKTQSALKSLQRRFAGSQFQSIGAFRGDGTNPVLSDFDHPDFNELINELVGIPLKREESLWKEPIEAVAARLRWPVESNTAGKRSYRYYPHGTYRLFGSKPYSAALYERDGHADWISIVYANTGDFPKHLLRKGGEKKKIPEAEAREMISAYIEEDFQQLKLQLEERLGEMQSRDLDGGTERCIWSYDELGFVLERVSGQYAALRILPSDQLSRLHFAQDLSRIELRDRILANVNHRDRGDVVIKELPMVTQGPKGYCVPATLERYFRYLGLQADMYRIAVASDVGVGGGVKLSNARAMAQEFLRPFGLKFNVYQAKFTDHQLGRYLEEGVPLLWSMHSTSEFNQLANTRTEKRRTHFLPEDWAEQLKAERESWKPDGVAFGSEHYLLITGYNPETDEIAISDSWGLYYAERWVSYAQAEHYSRGDFYVLDYR